MVTVFAFIYIFSASFVLIMSLVEIVDRNGRLHPEQGASLGDVMAAAFWTVVPVLNTMMVISYLNLLRKKINDL
jgi:hypothetical protein